MKSNQRRAVLRASLALAAPGGSPGACAAGVWLIRKMTSSNGHWIAEGKLLLHMA